jgi:hypothetical protein
MSVAIRGVDPDPVPDREPEWEAAKAHLAKIHKMLPPWAQKCITLDMDGDEDDLTVYVSMNLKLDDFVDDLETRIHVLNLAMVKS